MNKRDYLQAKEFIYSDIQREISLGRISNNIAGRFLLRLIIKNSGGGNFMAALALLCYTEFSGRIISGADKPKENFQLFFNRLGSEYENFGKQLDVYNIFRCGLAHEYFVKQNCTIAMLKSINSTRGIGVDSSGKYYFIVEKYFEDFKKAFDAIENQFLIEKEEGGSLLRKMATTVSVQRF